MQLARVIGNATATVKHESMDGWKLLIVRLLMADGKSPDGDPVIAIDSFGAGKGEKVLLTTDGRSTRELVKNDKTPVRWSVMGICDE